MATERIQKLAELLKQKDLLKQQDRELQNLRRKALANKAPEFWKSFVIDLSEAVDELKELGNPSKWEDLTVGGTPDNLEKVINLEAPFPIRKLLPATGCCCWGNTRNVQNCSGSPRNVAAPRSAGLD